VPTHITHTNLHKTLLFAASCALLLLPGAAPSFAQTVDAAASNLTSNAAPIDYLYVSPQGSDALSGQSPTISGGSGPFQTLTHAQAAVSALSDSGLARPVEVVLDPGVCPAQDFLGHWFSSVPTCPVIWHSDPDRTVLIYTSTMAEQIDALSAEDFANGPGKRIARFYVSPNGSDACDGLTPSQDQNQDQNTGSSAGPFRTLRRAQDAVNALQATLPSAPAEVVLEEGLAAAAPIEAAASPVLNADSAGKPAKKASKYTPAGLAALKALAKAKAHKAGTAVKVILPGGGIAVRVPINSPAAFPRLVFAHYMVSNRDYGGSVAGYERDIQDAQAAGIDGFQLNLGSWNDDIYKWNVQAMFQAAQALNSGFKLFFSADMTGMSFPEVTAMMTAYANNPYYWHIQQTVGGAVVSRPFLSTWGGEGGGYASAKASWNTQVFQPLRAAGINPYFVPSFFTTTPDGKQYVGSSPSAIATQISGLDLGFTDGTGYSGGLGSPTAPGTTVLTVAENYAAQLHAAGLSTFGGVSPQYWGSRQISLGRPYYEYTGGEGLEAQWNSILSKQKPNWVTCFTWNDFDEATYWSPIDDVNKYWPYAAHSALGFYKSHAGITKLNQYYINWYKTGVKPAQTSDSLCYCYRTHPKNATATHDQFGPVTSFNGNAQDMIYVTTLLTAPATLVVTTGGQTLTYAVSAGIGNTRVPFRVGTQSFQLVRGGRTVLSQTSTEPIIANPVEYNFNYYTGWITNQPATAAH